ncbi:DUF4834 domain-containing protein [Litoribacter ruber]|uniref:DUF4834 domain-containing protein n=1 Tax=Litoribacter ruber TaxID=702568 RepID=UPI001BD9A11A|nr:DUF4834 domain-containing protein [Litoribacter ruber]MBT0810945.1 DUF4834 domain-containing protein [Litoribacter ruber]
MGFILKFIIITFALSWIFTNLLRFFLKSKLKRFFDQMQHVQQQERPRSRPADGNVNVDFIPKSEKKKPTPPREIDGEYVDYIEVKD